MKPRVVTISILLVSVALCGALLPRVVDPDVWWGQRVRWLGVLAGLVLGVPSGLYVAFGSGARRRRLFRVVAGGVAGVFLVLMLELPTSVGFDWEQVFGGESNSLWNQLSRGVNRPDPELLHVHWPHGAYRGEAVGNLVPLGIPSPRRYPVDLRFDRNGFRNDVDFDRADIALIGDSFVEAALLPDAETVGRRLDAAFARPTVNLGQSGYGLRQELIVLERFGLPLEPKLVIWFFFGGNDLRDVYAYERDLRQLGKPRPSRGFWQRSFTRNLMRLAAELTTAPRREPSAIALSQSALMTLADGAEERVYFGQTNGPWKPREWTTAIDVLGRARELCRERGAALLLVYIPRKFRVYRDHVRTEPGSEIATWDVNALPETLGQWCGQVGIPYLDLTPSLRAPVAAGIPTYLVDDVHWNARGHAVAAEAIAAFVRRAGLLP